MRERVKYGKRNMEKGIASDIEPTYFIFHISYFLKLGKNCVQVVCESMNNWWAQLPQVIQNLWIEWSDHFTYSPFYYSTVRLYTRFSPTLSISKIRHITDKIPYLSTLSTPPIITTTIYI